MTGTKRLSLNMPADLFEAASTRAKASGLTMTRVIQAMLREYADGRIRVSETVSVNVMRHADVDPY